MDSVLQIISDTSGDRIDVFLGRTFEDLSRNYVQKLILEGAVTLNGEVVTAKKIIVQNGDQIEITVPQPEPLNIVAEDIPIEIVYEDDDLMIVNKPQGMVVHPAPGHYSGTLVNALMWNAEKLSSINGVIRPGIVHRIDKDTSGLLMVAKTDFAHEKLAAQLKDKSSIREYYAIVNGVLKSESGTIDAPISRHHVDRKKMGVAEKGKTAVTHYEVVELFRYHTLVKLTLETGRTHQIRVHMASIGHSVLGDPLYGLKNERVKHSGQALHAKKVGFIHPRSGEMVVFDSELPEYFIKLVNKCKTL